MVVQLLMRDVQILKFGARGHRIGWFIDDDNCFVMCYLNLLVNKCGNQTWVCVEIDIWFTTA